MFVTTAPWVHFYKNAVVSVVKPPTLLALLPDDQVGWCEQVYIFVSNVPNQFTKVVTRSSLKKVTTSST